MKKYLSILLSLALLLCPILMTACDKGSSPSETDAPEENTCEHVWGESEILSRPTCGVDGATQKTCTLCGSVENTAIPATQKHKFSNNVCSVCNSDKVSVNGTSIAKFVIVYAEDGFSKDIATALKNKLTANKGYTLEVKSASDGESEYEILIGNVSRAVTKDFFAKGKAYTDENFEVIVSGKKIAIATTSSETMEVAKNRFFKEFLSDKDALALTDSSSFVGNVYDINSRLDSTDIRISSFNILDDGCNATKIANIVGTVSSLDTDVISFQEYTPTYHKDVNGKLSELGFTQVTVGNGYTPTTNVTPMFYRADKLELVKSDYSHYFSVKLTREGSKSYTWALFKDKNSGKQFIVIGTHMTSVSSAGDLSGDQLRKQDAEELLEKAKSLSETYGSDIPIILTGDFNSTANTDAYKLIAKEFNDARNPSIAKVKYNTQYSTFHSLSQTPAVNNTGYVIDYFFTSKGNVSVNQIQHAVNPLSLKTSDHLPILLDIHLG